MADADVRTLCEVARRQMLARNLAGALATARRVLALDPEHPLAHRYAAACLVDLGQVNAGEQEARLALSLDPESPYPHYILGVVHENRGQLKQAHIAYRTALERAHTDPLFHRAAARVCCRLMLLDDARAYLVRALALDPASPDTLAMLGDLELRERQVGEAERLGREALALDPGHRKAHVLLGTIALHYRRDPAAAREHALSALADNPRDADALYLMRGITARRSRLLGLWWRYRDLTMRYHWGVAIGIPLILSAALIADDSSVPSGVGLAFGILYLLWLLAMTYFAISDYVFRRSLKKETRAVELNKNF